jgi:cytochrome c biogenesis protein CcmG/thiol:disulfide interchange protein DsbE
MRLLLIPCLVALVAGVASAQNISTLTTPLSTPDGVQKTIAELGHGKPTIVSFWATWCKPCKEEMKAMWELYQKMGGQFEYIAISIDNTKTMARVGPYIQSKGYQFPVLLDPNSEVFQMLGGSNVPFALMFNPDGTLHSKHDGFLPGDEAKIEEELNAMQPAH